MLDFLSELHSEELPQTLYHYTSQAGLIGIIEGQEIWATHTQFLNDKSEFVHALGLVRNEIKRRIGTSKDPDEQTILGMLEALTSDGFKSMNICVCSFSEIGDSLSQWRAYGGINSGFAIGFNAKFLEKKASDNDMFLMRCIYDASKHHTVVKQFVDSVVERALRNIKLNPSDSTQSPIGHYLPELFGLAPIIKDPSFKDEREWRIISRPLRSNSERFGYRQGNSFVIPYYRLPLSKSADEAGTSVLNTVFVGPTPDMDLSLMSVESLLASQQMLRGPFHPDGTVDVKRSQIPYRSW